MKVIELIELNQLIVDLIIEVRQDGTSLRDYMAIGAYEGVKPRYPIRVPTMTAAYNYCDPSTSKEGKYYNKSINARDDGKDYFQLKTSRIPKAWLDLEVYSWHSWNAYRKYSEGENLRIVALPAGEMPAVEKEKPKEMEGQTSIFDFIKGE